MFKRIICITLMLAAYFDMGGQNVLSGTVVDKNGNPVVGTKVSLKNGKQFTTTDFEGKFEIQANPGDKAVFDCVGMQEKKVKLEQNMTVPLRKTTIWNRRPTKWDVFINAQAMSGHPSFGLMTGAVKKVGGYVKFLMSPDSYAGKFRGVANSGNIIHHSEVPSWTSGKNYHLHSFFAGGAVVNLNCPLYTYLGGGYYRSESYYYQEGQWERNDTVYQCFAFDVGLLWRLNHLSINIGVAISDDTVLNLGIGYIF